jgi:hypothetical protein
VIDDKSVADELEVLDRDTVKGMARVLRRPQA